MTRADTLFSQPSASLWRLGNSSAVAEEPTLPCSTAPSHPASLGWAALVAVRGGAKRGFPPREKGGGGFKRSKQSPISRWAGGSVPGPPRERREGTAPPRPAPALPRARRLNPAMAEELAALPEEWWLYFASSRATTFRNWPFTEGCACTPERMAEAGFVHCPSENSPDVAQCFFCLKELEGWEPDDDPLEEHKKHSADCGFLSLQKVSANLTVQEFLKLDKMRMRKAIKKKVSQEMVKFEDKAKTQRCSIKNLV